MDLFAQGCRCQYELAALLQKKTKSECVRGVTLNFENIHFDGLYEQRKETEEGSGQILKQASDDDEGRPGWKRWQVTALTPLRQHACLSTSYSWLRLPTRRRRLGQ